ncbi:MAG: hypothetical protein AB1508_11295 [Pseudomonadota bacterium]
MQSAATLRKQFEGYRLQGAITRETTITDAGLVVGAGTSLMRMRKDRFGRPQLALAEDRERAIALYCVAFQHRPPPDFLRHLASASGNWPHDKALANLRLVFAQLPRLANEADAWRLHLAAALLDEEFSPSRLLSELGFAPFDFRKYDPEQPRVPAGNGRQSGEWGSTGGAASAPKVPAPRATASADGSASHDAKTGQSSVSPALFTAGAATRTSSPLLRRIAPLALRGLTEFASKVFEPLVFFDAIFIPSPNDGIRSEGTLPGSPGIGYSADHDTGTLELSTRDTHGHATTVRAQLRNGVYVDVSTGTPLGRDLNGVLYIDRDAATAALSAAKGHADEDAQAALASKDDEPKLCPAHTQDNPGATNNANAVRYAQYVSQKIVNPQRHPPLAPGLAFGLYNPRTGKIVNLDDCQDTTGNMQEYKAFHAWWLNNEKLMKKMSAKFIQQAASQIQANDFRNLQTGIFRPIDWHFKDRESAEFALKLFGQAGFLPKIRIFYTPEGTGTSEIIWSGF